MSYLLLRMKRFIIFGFLGISTLLFMGGCATGRLQKPVSLDPLILRIRDIINSPELKGTHWGIRVETDDGDLLVDYNSEIRVVPASTVKLLTTASALVLLGPNYQFPTEFVTIGYVDTSGILQGDLVIKGYGDPSLAALNQMDAIRLSEQWADTLRHLGLLAINGSVWGDAMVIQSQDSRTPWEVDDLHQTYGAKVSALSMADNSLRISVTPCEQIRTQQIWTGPANIKYWPTSTPIKLVNNVKTVPIAHLGWVSSEPSYGDTVESVVVKGEVSHVERPIHQSVPLLRPEALFLAVATEGMINEGIEVAGGIGGYVSPEMDASFNGKYYPGYSFGANYRDTLFVHWSAPLCEIIRHINTDSHNLGAELLIRHLGWATTGHGSYLNGKSVACQWFASAGLDDADICWVDGSGLARRNLLSPRWVVQLLQIMAHHPYSEEFRTSLAVIGESGTLKSRGFTTELAGRIWAKTGSMSHVSNISGYLFTRTGNRLVFSIMSNGTTRSIMRLQNAQDQILNILYELL